LADIIPKHFPAISIFEAATLGKADFINTLEQPKPISFRSIYTK